MAQWQACAVGIELKTLRFHYVRIPGNGMVDIVNSTLQLAGVKAPTMMYERKMKRKRAATYEGSVNRCRT